MNHAFRNFCVAVSVIAAGAATALLVYPRVVVRAQTPRFVAVYESTLQPLAPGVATRPDIFFIRAATSDGVKVRANLSGDPRTGGQVVFRRIDSTRDGVTHLVSDPARSVTEQKRGALDSARLHQAWRNSSCEQTDYPSEFLGRGQFSGYEVSKVRSSSPGLSVERWMAPALGCLTVFLRHESLSETGQALYAVEERAIQIDAIEPPAALTSVEPGFTQRDLAGLLAAVAAAEGAAPPEHLMERARTQQPAAQ